MRHLTIVIAFFVAHLGVQAGAQAPASQGSSDIVARFGEQTVSATELERAAGPALLPLRQQLYQVQRQTLERLVFERAVATIASAAGVPAEEYLRGQLEAGATPPSEEKIGEVLSQFRARLPQDEAEARALVVQYLEAQSRQEREQQLKQRLFADLGVEILLDPPRAEVTIRDFNPSHGPAKAPVTVVEYSDFQCPFCRRVKPTLSRLAARYEGQVRFLFKHLPLPMHPEARQIAVASLCAGDQGAFWPYHDRLFAASGSMGREQLLEHAAALELDQERFTACLDGGPHDANVDLDMADAAALGITGTPGFMINGRLVNGAQPYEEFVAVIDEELRSVGLVPTEEQHAADDAAAPAAPSADAPP